MTHTPSKPFTRAELETFAREGIRRRAEEIERELARLYRAAPDVFIGDGPPMLVAVERRPDGNSWPDADAVTAKRSASQKKSWTPARRKAQAARMKRLRPALGKAKLAKNTGGGDFVWQRVHAFLQRTDGHRATVKDIMAAADVSSDSTIAMVLHGKRAKLFTRPAPGELMLSAAGLKFTPDADAATTNGATA